jgi:hypothetical protein
VVPRADLDLVTRRKEPVFIFQRLVLVGAKSVSISLMGLNVTSFQ